MIYIFISCYLFSSSSCLTIYIFIYLFISLSSSFFCLNSLVFFPEIFLFSVFVVSLFLLLFKYYKKEREKKNRNWIHQQCNLYKKICIRTLSFLAFLLIWLFKIYIMKKYAIIELPVSLFAFMFFSFSFSLSQISIYKYRKTNFFLHYLYKENKRNQINFCLLLLFAAKKLVNRKRIFLSLSNLWSSFCA